MIDVSPYLGCAALVSDASAYTVALLDLLNDPDAERDKVSELISADPALVSRILTLANSAWIAATAPSTNVWDATRVLGFSMVRNLAAAGLVNLDESNQHLPDGYLDHAIAAAAGAAAVADRVGGKVRDAWSVALLHDLGTVLLNSVHGQDSASNNDTSIEKEIKQFGFDHATLGAAVLTQLRLPGAACAAIGEHNEPPHTQHTPLSLTVRAGIAIAELDGTTGCSAPLGSPAPFLRMLDLQHQQDAIIADLEQHASHLTSLLT